MFKWFKRHEHKWIVDFVKYSNQIDIVKTCSVCGKQIQLFSRCYANDIDAKYACDVYLAYAKAIKAQNPEYYVDGIDD